MPLPSRERRQCNRGKQQHASRPQWRGDIVSEAGLSGRGPDSSFEDVFIRSLVAASSCRQHRKEDERPTGSSWRALVRPDKRRARHDTSKRWLSSHPAKREGAAAAAELPALPEISPDEYKELVNTYPELDQKIERPREKPDHLPLAPRLVYTPLEELSLTPGRREIIQAEGEHFWNLKRFGRFIRKPLGRISHEQMWSMYQNLPSPRPRYLHDATINRIFRQLSWIQFRDSEITMRRYFELLDECVGEGVHLNREAWNGAVNYAARWLRNTTSNEVKLAVETWMRMENAGHQADSVTFNILFGVAVRAGRYALADTIYAELISRNLPINRYFRASMIYYAGVKRDGDGVRQAFRDLVNAGDIVDTAVMNCVILSLIRSGEPAAAENVFLRMKALQEQKFGVASLKDWRTKRQLARVLDRTGDKLRQEKEQHEASFFGAVFSADERREEVQKATPIAPDASTYALLIKHHAYTSGNLEKIRELLAEMKENEHHVHGSIYVHILRGFWTHGGYAFSAWNRRSLEDFWIEIVRASLPPIPDPDIPHPPEDTVPADDEADKSDIPGAMMYDQQQNKAVQGQEDVARQAIEDAEPNELERPTYFAKGLALAAVHAFYKCTGSKRMLEVWDEIQARWNDATQEERERVQAAVDRLIRQDSIYVH